MLLQFKLRDIEVRIPTIGIDYEPVPLSRLVTRTLSAEQTTSRDAEGSSVVVPDRKEVVVIRRKRRSLAALHLDNGVSQFDASERVLLRGSTDLYIAGGRYVKLSSPHQAHVLHSRVNANVVQRSL
jgi:hypothetical protein